MIRVLILAISLTFTYQVPIQEQLIGKTLDGSWETIMKDSVFPLPSNKSFINQNNTPNTFLQPKSGKADGLIYEALNSDNIIETWVFLRLLETGYLDGNVIEIEFPLSTGYNEITNSWQMKESYSSARLFSSRELVIIFDFEPDITVQKTKNSTKLKENALFTSITVKSDSIYMKADLAPTTYSIQPFLFMFLINVVQLGLLFYFGRNQRTFFSTSEWMILQTCCLFVVESLFMANIALSFYDTNYSYFLITALTNLLVMFLLLGKFEPVVQKFKNSLQWKLALAFTLLYFFIVWQFGHKPAFWVGEGCVFLWQIVHLLMNGGAGGVSIELVLVVILSRIPLLTTLGSSENIYRMAPHSLAWKIIAIITMLHLAFILLQKKFGSRFIIPKVIIPDYYDYRRSAKYSTEDAKQQCSICSNLMRESPQKLNQTEEDHREAGSESTFTEMEDARRNEWVQFVVTPCNHFYHGKCLGDWLKIKLVCPLCKRGLPPMSVVS